MSKKTYRPVLYRTLAAAALLACVAGALNAQAPSPFATGLENPSRIILGPDGSLLVTEAAATPNSGRISIVDIAGNKRALIDGLPSGLAAPDMSVDGPNGLALSGRTLYIANGEGDAHRNGPTRGTIVPNPAGPSSPMFSTILRVVLSKDADKLMTGFSLKLQDHFTLMDGATVTLTNASGDTAAVSLVTAFRVDSPDPNTIYRNTHLYSMALLPSRPDALFVADAGNNAIWQVDTTSGRRQLVVRFDPTPNQLNMGPPFIEAVPTSVRPYGNQLLVTLLSGAPFRPSLSRVMQVDPATGTATLFISLLTSSIDSIFRVRSNGNPQWFVLEYSIGSLASAMPPPGRLYEFNTLPGTILADGLPTPTGLALNETTNDLYILDRTDGMISKINVGN